MSRLLDYTPQIRVSPLQACAHSFFDELRDSNSHLPNGKKLPQLFNFTAEGGVIISMFYIEFLVIAPLHKTAAVIYITYFNV